MAWVITIIWWAVMLIIAQYFPTIGGTLMAWTLIDWIHQHARHGR